jgi:hypothetical protein
MGKLKILLLCGPLVLAGTISALAVPKGANGENCNVSSATGVKRTISGKDYVCDKCVYTKCDATGGQISNCRTVTHYSNCEAAAAKGGMQRLPRAPSGTRRQQ